MIAPAPGRARGDLALVLLAYFAFRVMHLFSCAPHDLLEQGSEELCRGAMGQGLLEGLGIPLLDYRADDYSGGSLVVGGLAALAFRVLGPSLFALKMVPLAFSTIALACWYVVVREQWGTPAARWFAVVFVVSPPLWTAYSLTAMGFHSESVAFTALTVLLAFRLWDGRGGDGTWAALGLTAGNGLWFVYTYALTLVSLAVFGCAFYRGRPKLRNMGLAAAGFVLGFCPWLQVAAWSNHGGFVIHQRPLWSHFDITRLWEGDLRASGPYALLAAYARDSGLALEHRLTNLAYCLVLVAPIAGWLAVRWRRNRRSPSGERAGLATFALLYLGVFVAVVQLSDFDAPRYRVVALPFLFALWAKVVSELGAGAAAWAPRCATALVVCTVLVGVAANVALFPPQPSLHVLRARGYSYLWIPLLLSRNQPDRWLEQSTALGRRFDARDRQAVEMSIALVSASLLDSSSPRDEVAPVLRQVAPSARGYFLFCLGQWIAARAGQIAPAIAVVGSLEPGSRADALEGAFSVWSETLPAQTAPETLVPPTPLTADTAVPHWRSVGRQAVRWWTARSARFPEALGDEWLSSSPHRERILEGVGGALVGQWRFGPSHRPLRPRDISRVPPSLRGELLRGIGRGLGELALCDETDWIEAQLVLEAADRARVDEGRAQATPHACW